MEKLKIKVCNGTTCFVMGSSKFQDFEERIPAKYKKSVDVRFKSCLDLCQNNEYSKSPYVMVEDEVISEATFEKILEVLERKLTERNSGEK